MHDRPDPPSLPREARQRWRLVVARDTPAPDVTQRDVAGTWEAAIRAAGLPLAWTEGATPRPRIAFGAPLPVGMAAGRELIDIVLADRWPLWRVRDELARVIPAGWRLVDLHDVWLGGPALAGRVAAADYRIELAAGPDPSVVERACDGLLAAARIDRERAKGGGTVRYDLRPLLLDVRVAQPGPPTVVVARTRFHPELGTGRPEEVIAALGDAAGMPIGIAAIRRERLLLADDPDLAGSTPGGAR